MFYKRANLNYDPRIDQDIPFDGLGTFIAPVPFDISKATMFSIQVLFSSVIDTVPIKILTSHLDEPDVNDPTHWSTLINFSFNENYPNPIFEWDRACLRWLSYEIDSTEGYVTDGKIIIVGKSQ